jgi:hypothetical protein
MGLDLTLSPAKFGPYSAGLNSWHNGGNSLSLSCSYAIFGQIAKTGWTRGVNPVCDPKPLPFDTVPGFSFSLPAGKGELTDTTVDAYGTPLTYVTAGELARVKLPKDSTPWNVAIFAMMAALPPETPVVLYWH